MGARGLRTTAAAAGEAAAGAGSTTLTATTVAATTIAATALRTIATLATAGCGAGAGVIACGALGVAERALVAELAALGDGVGEIGRASCRERVLLGV